MGRKKPMNAVAMMADGRRTKGKQPSTEDMLKMLDSMRSQLVTQQKREKAEPPPVAIVPAPTKTKSQEDQLLEMARESLRKYGTLVPPPEVLLMVQRHTCPHCGHEGPIATDFGFRRLKNGTLKYQSWCKTCKSSKDSHPSRNGLPVKSR